MVIVMNILNDARKTLMLWKDDFANEYAWNSVCKALSVSDDTEEIELKCDVITHFPYKH